jgi:hypothetical protein
MNVLVDVGIIIGPFRMKYYTNAVKKNEHYSLLLPRLTSNELPTAVNDLMFTLIESEWMDIQKD